MISVLERYNQDRMTAIEKHDQLEVEIAELQREMNKLEAYTKDIKTNVLEPIASELAERKGMKWKVIGPEGIRNAYRIVLSECFDDLTETNRSEYVLTVFKVTSMKGDVVDIRYKEYVQSDDDLTKGAVVLRRLPDTIEEIEKIMAYIDPTVKGVK